MAEAEPQATSAESESQPEKAGARTVSTRKVSVRALIVLTLVALVAYALDQFTKYLVVSNLVEGQQVNVLGEILQFHFVKNSGAAFSLASGMTWIFSIAASAVTVFIVIFARRIRSFGWAVLFGMLLGGTVGNLTDRFFRPPTFAQGHVIDFIQVYGFPAIFNIADSFIVASMGLFIILTIRGVGLDGRRTITRPVVYPDADRAAESAPSDPEPAGSALPDRK
ncbi:MAG: lspA [Microbacteriaceae bacterium]|nr:lspA [Microbacteriaceae bacterium]